MARPSFQFYPADWKNNANLRRCSEAARGCWMDILCILHDSDEYGVVRWPLDELARAAGVAVKYARELAAKNVLKGSDRSVEAYVHTPRHAGKDGEPVTLIDSGHGPCWYSSRMVLDEWRRKVSGGSTRFTSTRPDTKPTTKPITMPRQGEALGDGAISSSSSSPSEDSSSLRSEGARGKSGPSLPKSNRKTGLPQLFPGDPERDWAVEHWRSKGRADLCGRVNDEIDQFRDHHAKERSVMADWPAAWRTWVRNAMAFNRAPRPDSGGFSQLPERKIHKVA